MILLIDLSDVLIHGLYDMDKVVHYRFGEDIAKRFKERHDNPECWDKLQELCRGKITEEEYWKFFIGDEWWPEYVTPNIFKFALEENLKKCVAGTADVLRSIRGYTSNGRVVNSIPMMVLVSDNIREHIPFIMKEHAGIMSLFDFTYWSCDLGMVKKDEGFFTHIMELLDASPSEAILIDDYQVNLDAARKAGIKDTILFQNAETLRTDLESLGFVLATSSNSNENINLRAAMA